MSGNFVVYLIGYLIAIAGIAYGMSAAGLGQEWIIAVVLVMVGLGIVYALSRSERDTETRRASERAASERAGSERSGETASGSQTTPEEGQRH